MAEYEVYKSQYNNLITSILDFGDKPANAAIPMSSVTPVYWGNIINGNLEPMIGNQYLEQSVFEAMTYLPGTREEIRKIDGVGSKPLYIMENSNGLYGLVPVCVKYKSTDLFATRPITFRYNNGSWTIIPSMALNIWNFYRPHVEFKTAEEANAWYSNVVSNSTIGYLYDAELSRICIYIIYSNREYILYDIFRFDESSTLYGWSKTTVTGPDTPGDPPFPDPVNPYQPVGPSGESILPPGTFDNTSDAIPDSPLPTLSAANTGFTRIYNPTLAQVQDLARYLWTDETVIQTIWNHIKQYFEDPMQAIIGFNLVPCAVPDAGSQSFALMYIDTGVQMNVAANQFVDVDCGTVELERFYASALDQSPYTRVSCFLPFIGTVKLNTDEVMGTTLQVKYRIDICSGSCVAKIFVDGNVIYQYSGHCAINIPISSADFSSYVQATMSIAKLAVGAAVGGAMGAMTSSSLEPSQQTNRAVTTTRTETSTERNPATGRQVTAGTSTVTTTEESHSETSTKASFDYLTPSNIANTVGQVMGSKPMVEHTGSFSGNSGYLGVRRPFLIIERPNMCLPERYQHFNGYPSMITMQLSTCNGFTKVQQVELTGMTATNPEQGEILGLLKSGVYF